jgi:hypothetical protein
VIHRLVLAFPQLAYERFRETSSATAEYNCIAWSASRTDAWWEPSPDGYWPVGAPSAYTVDAYMQAYSTIGYEVTGSGDFEVRCERIVLFAEASGKPTHAARQLENGKWSSKLGQDVDIEHATPLGVSGQLYGLPVVFMRRPRPRWRWPLAMAKHLLAVALRRFREFRSPT